MSRNVIGLIQKIGRRRGWMAEEAVNTVLAEMKKGGEIASFYKTDRRADKFEGIDFFIIGLDGEKVPLQVKSSQINANNHRKKFPNVPVIVVKLEDDTKVVKDKIRGALK